MSAEVSARIEEARLCGFYPLILLLERLVGGSPVGEAASPAEELIRFRHDPALTFSTGDVARVREFQAGPPSAVPGDELRRGYEVTTTFLGLTGSVSPLPPYIAEEVAQEQDESTPMRDFLDLFHHRLLSLLYRGWTKHDLPNAWRADGTDPWSSRLLALLGVDGGAPDARPRLATWRLLRLAPLLAERTMTAEGLAIAIEDALAADLGDARVTVEPFVGAWVQIAEDQLTLLGRQAGRLGQDCLVGRRVLDVAGRFRVTIGPLSSQQYRLFAGGELANRTEELIAALVTEPLEHEVVLWLSEDAAPALCLGASRLGRDAWLGGQRLRARVAARTAA